MKARKTSCSKQAHQKERDISSIPYRVFAINGEAPSAGSWGALAEMTKEWIHNRSEFVESLHKAEESGKLEQKLSGLDVYDKKILISEYDGFNGHTYDISGVEIMTAFGGPNEYIDTYRQEYICCWGTDRIEFRLDGGVCDSVCDFFSRDVAGVLESKNHNAQKLNRISAENN